jgi:Putative zinc-finger
MAQMAINCQDVSARMMELLYGELGGDDRATIEAHLAACASCRAELAAFQTTRAAARRVLDADEPPASAHKAILRAAAAVVAAKQPQPIEPRPVPAGPSLWERFRARWTFPTFATIGAVAVVVLASKVFLEPDKTVELGRQALRSTPAEVPSAAPAMPPVGAGAPQEVQEAAKVAAEPAKRDELNEEQRLQHPAADKAPARSISAPAAQRRRAGGGTAGLLMKGSGVATTARAKARLSDELDDLSAGEDRADAPPATPAAKPAKREFAPPPPRAESASRSSPSTTGSLRLKDRESEDDLIEGNAAPRGSGGPAASGASAAPPAAHAGKAKKAEPPPGADLDGAPAASASTAASAPVPAPAPAPAVPGAEAEEGRRSDKRDTKSEAKSSAESPVARADRLFAEGHWAAAARAYRDLLRHDPNNADAARWRQRLAASQDAASAQAPAAASPER